MRSKAWRLAAGLAAALALVGCAGQAPGTPAQPPQAMPPQSAGHSLPPSAGAGGSTGGAAAAPEAVAPAAAVTPAPAGAAGSASAGAAEPTAPAPASSAGGDLPPPLAYPGGKPSAPAVQAAQPQAADPSAQLPEPMRAETPASGADQEAPAETKPSVQLSIVGDKDTGTILEATSVEIQDGDSAFDVLQRIAKARNIQLEYRGKGMTAYVEGIANLYEFDKGAKSGWMFRVNGAFPNKSAGSYKVKKGDRIEWVYTLDMGKDVGDKPE